MSEVRTSCARLGVASIVGMSSRETRMDLPPTRQHQGQTATGDKLKWQRGLVHDPVEKYTPGRTHDGTIHVWIHPSVVGNSFGGKLFVDGSLICKH